MLRRRKLLRSSALAALSAGCARYLPPPRTPVLVNDIHSQLNATNVDRMVPIDSIKALRNVINQARQDGDAISIAVGRHAMDRQQFGERTAYLLYELA